MAETHGVLFLLTGDLYGAIKAEAAVQALEDIITQGVLVLVLSTATHGVLVCFARRKLHLELFFPT